MEALIKRFLDEMIPRRKGKEVPWEVLEPLEKEYVAERKRNERLEEELSRMGWYQKRQEEREERLRIKKFAQTLGMK